MYAHVGGLTKRVNVLSKQDELFFASMYKEQRKAHAWELFVDHPGFCHASWSPFPSIKLRYLSAQITGGPLSFGV